MRHNCRLESGYGGSGARPVELKEPLHVFPKPR